jgi:predicted ATPase
MLKKIYIKNVGPDPKIDLDCASQLNILIGDNGLGKTFYSILFGGVLQNVCCIYRNAN